MKSKISRAKRKDNKEWVEGFYFCMVHDDKRHEHHFIIPIGADLSKGTPIEKIQVEIDIETICDDTDWIPCSERLPEKENVLCYAVSLARNPDTIFVGAYRNGVWFLQSAIATISYPTQYKVTAWMPLPEPWKGE